MAGSAIAASRNVARDPLRIKNYRCNVLLCLLTNKTPVGTYGCPGATKPILCASGPGYWQAHRLNLDPATSEA